MGVVVFFVLTLGCFSVQAQEPLFEPGEWDEQSEVWLARAMVSEADWWRPDHVAIAWVLYHRWKQRQQRQPEWTFVEQVRAYCAGLRGKARSRRSRWVRSLEGEDQPEDWRNSDGLWRHYVSAWMRTRELARAWARGELPNRCRSRATHWGGPMDPPGEGTVAVDCGRTRNIFYRKRREVARATPQ